MEYSHDALVAKEQELMRLNAQLDDAAVVSLADNALQNHDILEHSEASFEQDQHTSADVSPTHQPSVSPSVNRASKNKKILANILSESLQRDERVENEKKWRVRGGEGGESSRASTRQNSPEHEQQQHQQQEQHEDDDDILIPAQVGLEGQVRLQKARIRALNDEARKQTQRAQILEERVSSMQSSSHGLREDNIKLKKMCAARDSAVDRAHKQDAALKATNATLTQRIEELEQQLRSMRIEQRNKERQVGGGGGRGGKGGTAATEGDGVDVRLNRALEEIERLRIRTLELETEKRDMSKAHALAKKKWSLEVDRQDKHKAELFSAFRKQSKLVDILKRQKLHMEAARQLAFTEDEFCRILDAQPTDLA